MHRSFSAALLVLLGPAGPLAAQSSIGGRVVGSDGRPLGDVAVRAARTSDGLARETITDTTGAFRLTPLGAGVYTVTARRVGYRSAEHASIRVAESQSVTLTVTMTQAPFQLSTIRVLTSRTAVNAATPELSTRLDREYTALLPSARNASSLISLVPGARKDQLWGGAPGVSNDYRLDGISMNHPGLGGDFLALSVDWIEALDVRGLGAGAEHGNFQGGIINAITRTGSNVRRHAVRANYEAPELTASNFNADELGVEQAGRRELSGEALGPVARDRVFYFVAGQLVSRDLRSPDLATPASGDFQRVRERQLDGRGLAKLTWLPAIGQRVDVLGGFSSFSADHAGINGIDDPSATAAVRRPTAFYGIFWTNAPGARNALELRVAGFTARETRQGYAGPHVPGIQRYQAGRTPSHQNIAFNERLEPSSIGATVQWRTTGRVLHSDHQLLLGADVARTRWTERRTRNGGLTWRPFTAGATTFDPADVSTWPTTGSDWGGERRLDSDMASEAVFVQDYITLGPTLTLTPGVRYGHWTGYITPACAAGQVACYRFDAVHSEAIDPRIGVVWDPTGRDAFALKAHWGRYHQGMFSLFFDRAAGANAYSNSRFYYSGPPLTSPTQTFTPEERDAPGSGFSPFFDEFILNESGRVERYRQPFVDQLVLGVERALGARWKAELSYVTRRNGDIVGLVDRNRATNYSLIGGIGVHHRLALDQVLDVHGNPLRIPLMYVGNNDLVALFEECTGTIRNPVCTANYAGWTKDAVQGLTWNPDYVLTTIPEARRRYRQLTALVRTEQTWWYGEASVTTARLRGNVAGVTGYGTAGTRFSAGQYVRPNEGIKANGRLPDALDLEAKIWLTARLPRGFEGGMLYTHILGERFTPGFRIDQRYVYTDASGNPLPSALFRQVLGQSVFLEERGARQYASRDLLDLHLAWQPRGRRLALTVDAFNVFGSQAVLEVNTNVGDETPTDPTSFFGVPKQRVSPRAFRLGLRLE